MPVFLFLLLLVAQDPADKVKALVDKLKNEEIAVRDSAAAELIKLGAPALPAVRAQFDRARGDTRDQLEKIIRRLEIAERIAALSAPGPLITLAAKDRPADEVLAEIRKQGGVIVEGMRLPADTRFTIDVRDASVWKAVDELCRVHGKVMYAFDSDRILVRPGAYRKLPTFDLGPYRFVVDALDLRLHTGEVYRNFELHGGLLAPPGRFPDRLRIKIEKFEDEGGNDVSSVMDGERGYSSEGPPYARDLRPPVIFRALTWLGGDGPLPTSTRLKSFSGTVLLNFAMNRTRLVAIKNPLAPGDRSMTQGGCELRIREVVRDGARVRFKTWFQRPMLDEERKGDIRYGRFTLGIYDAQGRRLRGLLVDENVSIHREQGEGVLECSETMTFEIPEGFVPESLDLDDAPVTHDLAIPFNLDGVSLR